MPFLTKEKTINKVIRIPVDKIVPNPHQPRKFFGEDLGGLAESIKLNGILQPITVREMPDGYELIAGERRLRAAKINGMTEVPCIVMKITERNSALLALVENIQRANLSFFEEADAIEKLIDFYGMTQEDAAAKLGKSQSTVANKLRLLRLGEEERRLICEYGLTERHARALLKLKTSEEQCEVIKEIFKRRLNVEAAERYIDELTESKEKAERMKRFSGAFKDVRLFVNTLNKAVDMMRLAGINAASQKIEEEGYIEYIVRIPTG
ncbi:MAG: ParB/RepB/Spo0J family partition protein [Oscillospiraceae bacterium]|nr:ParB/RepB/Spo0J family partition protein [Oscillospiraceae bacterium]